MKRWIFAALVFIAFTATAQIQEQLTPTEKKYQSIVTQPLTLYKGFYRVGTSLSFAVLDKYFTDKGKKELVPGSVNASTWTFSSFVQYGITDRLQVDLLIPYYGSTLKSVSVFESTYNNSFENSAYNTPQKGLSDVQLTASYQLIQGNYRKPAVGFSVLAILPTGQKNPTKVDPANPQNYNEAPGAGYVSIDPTLTARIISFPYSFQFSVDYRKNFSGSKLFHPTDSVATRFKTGNHFVAAASFNMHLNNWVILKSNADFGYFMKDKRNGAYYGGTSYIMRLYPGLSFQLKSFRIAIVVVFPVAGRTAAADPSYQMNLEYIF